MSESPFAELYDINQGVADTLNAQVRGHRLSIDTDETRVKVSEPLGIAVQKVTTYKQEIESGPGHRFGTVSAEEMGTLLGHYEIAHNNFTQFSRATDLYAKGVPTLYVNGKHAFKQAKLMFPKLEKKL